MYWVHNLNKTVGKRREREQGKREIDKEICMDDWQYPRINLPFAYFKWLQVKCSGSIYLNKTVGENEEKESRETARYVCMTGNMRERASERERGSERQRERETEREREQEGEREGARETKRERESIYLLHSSSGCRSNVLGP